jgi:hypothetical protein
MLQTAQSHNLFNGKPQATVSSRSIQDPLYFLAVASGLPLNELATLAE